MPRDPLLGAVEQNIAESLSIDSLAEAGFLSRSQLYREFYDLTGHSVKEYIRRRRLSKALALIRHTDMSLTRIAQDCGFGSSQALCKSVKAAIGQSPSQYKAGEDEYFFPMGEDRRALPVAVAAETIPPTLRLRYYDSRLRGIEERALARLFAALPGYRGRVFGRNGRQKGAKLCYELYIEHGAPVAGFAEIARRPAVSCTFAKTVCPNTEAEINAAWDYLYNGWLVTSMFAVDEGQPYFEEYLHVNGRVSRLALCLPVQKKPGFHKIRLCRCGAMQFLVAGRSGADAEKAASGAVMGFLAAHSPRLAQTARQFYVSRAPLAPSAREGEGLRLVRADAAHYTCGIALQAPLELPPGCGLRLRTHPAGEYAVLEGGCCGDTEVYESVLAAWVEGMGLRVNTEPFAVYETDGGYARQDIRVKIYQEIQK